MAFYRIYILDAAGRIASAADAMCEDDSQAAAAARVLLRGHPAVEIWSGTRLVGSLAADADGEGCRNEGGEASLG